MKAQFVSENIKFERGKDPKDSMKIGRDAQIREILRDEFLKMAGFDLDRFDWDYEYRKLEGYDTFIIHVYPNGDREIDRYYALAPGLATAVGAFTQADFAYDSLKSQMMKGSLGL